VAHSHLFSPRAKRPPSCNRISKWLLIYLWYWKKRFAIRLENSFRWNWRIGLVWQQNLHLLLWPMCQHFGVVIAIFFIYTIFITFILFIWVSAQSHTSPILLTILYLKKLTSSLKRIGSSDQKECNLSPIQPYWNQILSPFNTRKKDMWIWLRR
jgi:hypothetical protein